jgi:hypothetical protein
MKRKRPNSYAVLSFHNSLIIHITFTYSLLMYSYFTFKIPSEIILRLAKASNRELL